MRKNIIIVLVTLALSCAISFAKGNDDEYDTLNFPTIKYNLPEINTVLLKNGIKIYSLPNSKSPLFEIFVLVKFNSTIEKKLANSLNNALKQNNAEKIKILREKGGAISFKAVEGGILFSCSTLKEYSDEVLILVEEIFSNIVLPKQWAVNSHNSVQKKPIKASRLADIEFDRRLFDTDTTKNSTSKIHPKDKLKIVVGISGQVDIKKIKDSLNHFQGVHALNNRKKIESNFTKKYAGKTTIVNTATSLKTDYLRMGFLVPGIQSKDHYALLIINEILNHHLLSELRIKRGLVYSVNSFYGSDEKIGKIVISSRVHPRRTSQIVEMIKQRLSQSFGSIEEGVEIAKSYLHSKYLWKISSDTKLLEEILRLESFGLSNLYIAEYFKNVERVSSADIENIFNKYFTYENLVTVVLSSKKTFSEK